MLPDYFRFLCVNETGQLQTYNSGARLDVGWKGWKLDGDGALVYQAQQTDDFGFGTGDSISNGSDLSGTAVNNGSDKYMGLAGIFHAKTNHASTAGEFHLFVEISDDGGTTWPSDKADFDPMLDDAILLATIPAMTSTRDDVEKPFVFEG
ncbi:MAG: hypothetical protein HQ581_11940 [Planctomycetes bacterium]|nr:hypothetical protein [Planctomycetota bacterium]